MRLRQAMSVLTLMAVLGAGGGCEPGPDRQPAQPSGPGGGGWEVLAETDGAQLSRHRLAGTGLAYLQRIDLRKMRIDQVIGERTDSQPPARGEYYPGVGSPRFRRITAPQMQGSCQSRYGAKAFSAVNFSFFEEYDADTRLSFPVKAAGVVVSAGSSPYGPVAAPRHAHYRTVALRALAWDGQQVTISRYDPGTGAPLSRPGFPDALVTYAYADHPSYVLNHDPANRYQLLGVAGADHAGPAQRLLVLTVENASLAAAASLLREQGAAGDILTFDGGVSTFLWSGTRGNLVTVQNRDGALPHFLCVHAG